MIGGYTVRKNNMENKESRKGMHISMTLSLAYLNNRLVRIFTTSKLLTKEHMALFVVNLSWGHGTVHCNGNVMVL